MFHWNSDRGQQWRLDHSTVLPAPCALLRHHCSRVSTSPLRVWKKSDTRTAIHTNNCAHTAKNHVTESPQGKGPPCLGRNMFISLRSKVFAHDMLELIPQTRDPLKHVVLCLLPPPSDLLPEHRASDECNPNCNVPSPQQRLKYIHSKPQSTQAIDSSIWPPLPK